MNKELLNAITKYVVILIILGFLLSPYYTFIADKLTTDLLFAQNIASYTCLGLTLLLIVSLIMDSLKLKTSIGLIVLLALATYVYPVLGVAVYCVLFLTQKKEA